MNKNTLIGLLIAVVVLGGGYLLLKKNSMPTVVNQTSTSSTTQTPASTPATSVAGAPEAVTGTSASTSSSTAVVTGQVKPDGAATTYWFDYGETTAFGTRSTEQAVGSGYSLISTPAYVTGLKANTLYYFRLSARNRFATVNGATYSFMTNNNPPPQGLAPTAHTTSASNVSRTAVNLNGQVNPNGSSTIFWFEYGKDAGLGSVTTLQSIGSGTAASSVSVPVSNLDPLTKYYFRLNTQNQYGTVNGVTMSFTTTGPSAPSQPSIDTTSATDVSAGGAQFNGRVNPNGAETTYWFEYGSDSLLSILIGSGTNPQTVAAGTDSVKVEASVTGLQSNTNYYYRLVGRNAYGTVRGDIVSFKTRP